MRHKTLSGVVALCALLSAPALTAWARAGTTGAPKPDAARSLTQEQKLAIRRIQAEAEKQAAPAAARLTEIVGRVYENMLADAPDERLRADLGAQMKEATWALLAIKGRAIYDTLRVLTPAQRQIVRAEMRKPGAPSDLSEVVAHTFKLDEK